MKLNNEFTVSAPLDRTWATLLDVERVGSCLPGAQMDPADETGVYRGRMKMKLGPMAVAYEGTARLIDVDEDAHVSVMDVKGREAKGQGTAAATIRNRLAEAPEGTRVMVETDLQVTGRQAQFGRGIMEDVAGRMLGQFAKQLEQLINEDPQGPTAAGGTNGAAPAAASATATHLSPGAGQAGSSSSSSSSAPPPSGSDDDVLDVGSVVGSMLKGNLPIAGAVLALLLVVLAGSRVARGRRRSVRVELRL